MAREQASDVRGGSEARGRVSSRLREGNQSGSPHGGVRGGAKRVVQPIG